MSKDNIPNLSSIADNDFTFADLDSMLAQETMDMSKPSTTYSEQQESQSLTAPVDRYTKEMEDILDSVDQSIIEAPDKNISRYLEDESGYKEPTKTVSSEDPYELAFDIIKDLDLIRLPEGVLSLTEEEVAYYKQQTYIAQREDAIALLRGNVGHDPAMLEVFDYVLEGGSFADLPKFKQLVQTEIDYENLDLKDIGTQKELVRLYLSEGLNPNNTKDRELLAYIPDRIESLAGQGQLEAKAKDSQRHFVNNLRTHRELEKQRVIDEQLKAYEYAKFKEEENRNWHQEFRNELYKRSWNDARKDAVLKENKIVTLEDGTKMPMWEYKRQVIFNDPALFQQFLDFTSNFNLENGTFENRYSENTEVNQAAINKVLERAQSKSQSGTKGGTVDSVMRNPAKDNKTPIVNLYDDWV